MNGGTFFEGMKAAKSDTHLGCVLSGSPHTSTSKPTSRAIQVRRCPISILWKLIGSPSAIRNSTIMLACNGAISCHSLHSQPCTYRNPAWGVHISRCGRRCRTPPRRPHQYADHFPPKWQTLYRYHLPLKQNSM